MKTYTTSEKIFYEKVLIRTLCKLPDYNPYKQTITPGSMLRKDLNLDSLDIVDTLCRLGDKYGITLDYGNFDKFQTVADVQKCNFFFVYFMFNNIFINTVKIF